MARSIIPSGLFSFRKITTAIACLCVVGGAGLVSTNDVHALSGQVNVKASGVKSSVKNVSTYKHSRREISKTVLKEAFKSFGHHDTRTVIAIDFGNDIVEENIVAIDMPKPNIPHVQRSTDNKPFKKGSRKILSQNTLKITGLQLIAGGKELGRYSNRPKLEKYTFNSSAVTLQEVAKPKNGLRLIAGNRHNNNGIKIGELCKNINFCIVSNSYADTSENFEAVKVASVPKSRPVKSIQTKTKQKVYTGPRIIMLDKELR